MFATATMAETVTITIDKNSGEFTASNAIGNWHRVWQSYDSPTVTLSVGANNMTVTDDSDYLQLWVGSGSTYTLAAPEGYCVAGYNFDFIKAGEYTNDVTLTVEGKAYAPTNEIQSVEVTGLKEETASFTLTGANNGILVSNFVVTLESVTNCTITYNYILNEEVCATESIVAIIGASYPTPTLTPYGVETTAPEGNTTGDETIDLECTYDNSIRFASDFASISTWYYVCIHSTNKWYWGYSADQQYIPAGNAGSGAVNSVPEDNQDAYTWAFIGNPFQFKIVNMVAGEGMVLASTDPSLDATNGGETYPLVKYEADLWEEESPYWYAQGNPNVENGIFIYQHGTKYALNTRQPALAFWTQGADVGSTVLLTVRDTKLADEELLDALAAALEDADILLNDEAGYSESGGKAYDLQGDDATAPYYVWTNAPEPNEGSIAALFDGDPSTFFHSNWSEDGLSEDNGPHYLAIDLGEGNELSEFGFRYMTRNAANDHAQEIIIQGSNDNVEYTDIITISEGLPVGSNKEYLSEPIEAGDSYRYLRFVVTKTNMDRIGAGKLQNYFHMAEFALETPFEMSVTGGDEYIPYIDALKQLYDMYNIAMAIFDDPESTENLVIETTEDLVELTAYVRKLASESDDEETIAYLAKAKELIALTGVGYPAEEPRAALQAVIDEVSAKPTTANMIKIQEAVNTYMATTDIILPEYGKKYTFTMVAKNGNKFYLNYTGEDVAIVECNGEAYPASAAFECELSELTFYEEDSVTIAAVDTAASFKTNDGNYLVYHSKYSGITWLEGNGSTTGFQSEKNVMTHISLEKILPSQYVVGEYSDLFGLMAWQSYRGWHLTNNTWVAGYVVMLTNGTDYDGATAPFWNDGYSSAFMVEEYVEGETGSGTTAIESIESRPTTTVIYDLTGRRVENPTRGLYIINGKKVLVK